MEFIHTFWTAINAHGAFLSIYLVILFHEYLHVNEIDFKLPSFSERLRVIRIGS